MNPQILPVPKDAFYVICFACGHFFWCRTREIAEDTQTYHCHKEHNDESTRLPHS